MRKSWFILRSKYQSSCGIGKERNRTGKEVRLVYQKAGLGPDSGYHFGLGSRLIRISGEIRSMDQRLFMFKAQLQ